MNREGKIRDVADPTVTGEVTAEPTNRSHVDLALQNGLLIHVAAPPSPMFAGTLSEQETLELLCCTQRQLTEARLSGRLRHMRCGREFRFRLTDIEDYATSLVTKVKRRGGARVPPRHRQRAGAESRP